MALALAGAAGQFEPREDLAAIGEVSLSGHILPSTGVVAVALNSATTDCAEFADRISIADDQPGRLVRIFLVLRIVTDRGELINMVIPAYYRRTINDDMTVDARTAADFDVVANNRKGTNLDVIRDAGAICDDRRCMNLAHLSPFSNLLTR